MLNCSMPILPNVYMCHGKCWFQSPTARPNHSKLPHTLLTQHNWHHPVDPPDNGVPHQSTGFFHTQSWCMCQAKLWLVHASRSLVSSHVPFKPYKYLSPWGSGFILWSVGSWLRSWISLVCPFRSPNRDLGQQTSTSVTSTPHILLHSFNKLMFVSIPPSAGAQQLSP